MASVLLRNLPDEVHRALKVRAAANHRATGAEIRAILEEAVLPKDRVHLGSELFRIGKELGGVDLTQGLDRTPYVPVSFE